VVESSDLGEFGCTDSVDGAPHALIPNTVGWLVSGSIVASLVSIFLSSLLFTLAILTWMIDCIQRRKIYLKAPPFTGPLIVFFGLVLLSIVLSPEPLTSSMYLKKFLKFFAVFLVFTYFSRAQIERTIQMLLLVLGASAVWSICQFFWVKEVSLLNRIDGFMSHWMTYSGQLMIGSVVLAGYLLLVWWRDAGEQKVLGIGFTLLLLILLLCVVLTYTRSAWIGLLGGVAVLLASVKFRWVALGGVVVIVLFFLLPSSFKTRFYSSFDVRDTTTSGRLELLEAGIEMIRSNPLSGVGPRLVYQTALENREQLEGAEKYLYQHLHNNFVQVAAELGLPAAIVWLAIWLRMVWDFIRFRRRCGEDRLLLFLSTNGLCTLVAFHLMGLFEYNFGDSEIVILILFFVTVPYVLAQGGVRATAKRVEPDTA
jgi:O-antigen ligase